MKQYRLVALGGTFDHFHRGHEQFLAYAFSLSQQVIIGVTTDQLARKKPFSQAIQSVAVRKQAVVNFLEKKQLKKRAKFVFLKDIYGPTVQPDSIQALVATKVTYSGAVQVNRKRQQLGLTKLPVHVCPMVKSDDGQYLSSTRIRQGRVSLSGRVYRHLFRSTQVLPEKVRQQLRKPQGELLKTNIVKNLHHLLDQQPQKVALVGDVVTQLFQKQNLPFDYAAVDLKIGRKPVKEPFNYSFKQVVHNKPGTISKRAVRAIWRLQNTKSQGIIKVIGEEDLLVIPFVLSLPLTGLVIYGQPHQGVVVIKVEERIKNHFSQILS